MKVVFGDVAEADFETLVQIRIEAMRESLEKVGRFDPKRARVRFRDSFLPEHTRTIFVDDKLVGFYALNPKGEGLNLDHLYICPHAQGRGIGQIVLDRIFTISDKLMLPVTVGALKGSDSNRFYVRHGFELIDEGEWDLYYRRLPTSNA